MSITLPPVAALLIRVVLLLDGLLTFSLSFFHGFDLNVGFFLGISMIAVAASPYAVSSTKLKIWGVSTSTAALILYSYFVVAMLKGSLSIEPVELWDIVHVIPLLCLVYLLVYFANVKTKRDKQIVTD